MTSATIDTSSEAGQPNVRDRVVDACGQIGHLSHEARLLKSRAVDAIEDRMVAARRAVTSARRGVEDLTDQAAHQVRRQPLKTVALVLGVGLALGLAAGWAGRGSLRRQ